MVEIKVSRATHTLDDKILQDILTTLTEERSEFTMAIDFNRASNGAVDDKMLQNILIQMLAEEGVEEPTSSNDFNGVSNGKVGLYAAQDVGSQNRHTEQADPMLQCPAAGDGHMCITDLIPTLPIFLYEVHDEEYPNEPRIGFSLGRPIVWWDYMEFSTTAEVMSQHHQ